MFWQMGGGHRDGVWGEAHPPTLVLACCIHSFYSNSFGDCSLPLYWIRFAKFSITDNKGRRGPVIADAVVYLRSDHAPSKNLRSDRAPQKFNQNQTV